MRWAARHPGRRGVVGYKLEDSGLSVVVLLSLLRPGASLTALRPHCLPPEWQKPATHQHKSHLGASPSKSSTMLTILALASLVLLGTGKDRKCPLDFSKFSTNEFSQRLCFYLLLSD